MTLALPYSRKNKVWQKHRVSSCRSLQKGGRRGQSRCKSWTQRWHTPVSGLQTQHVGSVVMSIFTCEWKQTRHRPEPIPTRSICCFAAGERECIIQKFKLPGYDSEITFIFSCFLTTLVKQDNQTHLFLLQVILVVVVGFFFDLSSLNL